MATVTRTIGPADHGRRMTLDDFAEADFEEGWLYELARGTVVVTEVPGIRHGFIVMRLSEHFATCKRTRPGIIKYRAGGGECRIGLPGMQSNRRPDQALYLMPPPPVENPWTRWCPTLVVEVVSEGGEDRDYVQKREEYLRAGIVEYWILDPSTRQLRLHLRAGDAWEEQTLGEDATHRPHFLPGLEVRPGDLFGPAY